MYLKNKIMHDSKKKDQDWDIGEFVSYQLIKDEGNGKFKITVEGDIKYSHIFADKIGNLRIKRSELKTNDQEVSEFEK